MVDLPMPTPTAAVLAFGANLGDREQTIRDAALELAARPGILSVVLSPLVESVAITEAGPSTDEPAYLNAVALIDTTLSPRKLLQTVLNVEQLFGRVRSERWAARTLDIDIVAFGQERINEPDLVVPHPHAAQRLFVLNPWLELDPHATIVGAGSVATIAAELEARQNQPAEVTP